MVIYTY